MSIPGSCIDKFNDNAGFVIILYSFVKATIVVVTY